MLSEAYDKTTEDDQLTGENLKGMFDEYHNQVIKVLDDQIKDVYTAPQVEEARADTDNVFPNSVMDDTVDDTNIENE